MATSLGQTATRRLEQMGRRAGEREFRRGTPHDALRMSWFQSIEQELLSHPLRSALIGLGCGLLIGAAVMRRQADVS